MVPLDVGWLVRKSLYSNLIVGKRKCVSNASLSQCAGEGGFPLFGNLLLSPKTRFGSDDRFPVWETPLKTIFQVVGIVYNVMHENVGARLPI